MRSRTAATLIVLALAVCLAPSRATADATPCAWQGAYPGDAAPKAELAAWIAAGAIARGLPAELPVMGALVESEITNAPAAGQDSAGFFQIRTSIWDQGEYAGFPDHPELQLEWFADQSISVNQRRADGGQTPYGQDSAAWGMWVADVLRPPEQYRGRYQLRLTDARVLIAAGCGPSGPTPGVDSTPPAVTVSGSRVQHPLRSSRIVVEVACPLEACVARAQSRLLLPGAARTYRIRSPARRISKGRSAKLVLRLGPRVRRSLRRRLTGRGALSASVSIRASDAAGNTTAARRMIRLRR